MADTILDRIAARLLGPDFSGKPTPAPGRLGRFVESLLGPDQATEQTRSAPLAQLDEPTGVVIDSQGQYDRALAAQEAESVPEQAPAEAEALSPLAQAIHAARQRRADEAAAARLASEQATLRQEQAMQAKAQAWRDVHAPLLVAGGIVVDKLEEYFRANTDVELFRRVFGVEPCTREMVKNYELETQFYAFMGSNRQQLVIEVSNIETSSAQVDIGVCRGDARESTTQPGVMGIASPFGDPRVVHLLHSGRFDLADPASYLDAVTTALSDALESYENVDRRVQAMRRRANPDMYSKTPSADNEARLQDGLAQRYQRARLEGVPVQRELYEGHGIEPVMPQPWSPSNWMAPRLSEVESMLKPSMARMASMPCRIELLNGMVIRVKQAVLNPNNPSVDPHFKCTIGESWKDVDGVVHEQVNATVGTGEAQGLGMLGGGINRRVSATPTPALLAQPGV